MTTSQQSRLGLAPEEGMKAPVVTISSGQETLFDVGQSIAGVVIADQDRVAINAQTDSLENGIYVARAGKTWERATDMNLPEDVESGQLMSDANTSAVYSLVVPPGGWLVGQNSLSFGLLLSPVGFFWGAITGTLSNQADLQLELDAKAALVHTHVEADITDLQAYILDAAGSIAIDGEFYARRNADWEVIDFSVFAPAIHAHVEADIVDLQPYLLDAAGSIANDNQLFARANNGWQAFSTSSGTTGEIIAWPDADVPQNFLDCDGQSYNAVTFADLFAVLGYKYGGSGANFNVPDLRGQFIRGTANGSGQDPDRLSRLDRGDGTTGDQVGTKQLDEFKLHGHTVPLKIIGSSEGGGGDAEVRAQNTATSQTGGSETRSRNIGLNYIIRYTGGGSGITQPPSIEVQDEGVPLTTAVQLFNFEGFRLTQDITDQITVSFGSSLAAGQYCPDYAFTFVSTTQWRIGGVDATHLFRAGRRLRFIDGAANYFGTVISSTFGINTDIIMDMDAPDVLTATITEVCLVTSATAWSPIAEDPFSGDQINDAAVGVIDTVTYIFAVGNNGKAAISSNGGLNWTLLTTGTAEHLTVCIYDAVNETFWGGGGAGVLINTIDGSAITLDTVSIAALPTTGDARIIGLSYDSGTDALVLLYQDTNVPAYRTASSIDQGATWTSYATLGNCAEGRNNLVANVGVGGGTGPSHYGITLNNTGTRVINTYDDVSFSTSSNMSPSVCARAFWFDDGDQAAFMLGGFDGASDGVSVWSGRDDVTFSSRVRDYAYSIVHQRLVMVGDDAQIGFIGELDKASVDAWSVATNGFDPLADILSVVWDDFNGTFVAFASNGQICRSSNGLGDPIDPPIPFVGWTAIAADPFSGTRINRIMAGSIGGTNYWVIVGATGQLFTSVDAGITWIQRTTGTTQEILCLYFDTNTSTFFAGCAGGDFLTSTDGTTWTLDNTTFAALGTDGSFALSLVWYDTFAGLWWVMFQDSSISKETRTSSDFITWTARDTAVVQNSAQRGVGKGSVVDNRIMFCNVDDISYVDGATDTTESTWFGETTGDYKIALHTESGTDGNARDMAIGSVSGLLQQIDTGVVDASTPGSDQVNSIHKSSIASRWIAVGNNGSIKTLDGTLFKTASWIPVTNPFTNHITDVHYDATDDMFIAVAQNGQICRSVDGIS